MSPDSLMITAGLGAIGWLLKELIQASIKNTNQLAVLNSKITDIITATNKIPKIESDINALHSKMRTIQKEGEA